MRIFSMKKAVRSIRVAEKHIFLLFFSLFLASLSGCPAGESFEKHELIIQAGAGKVTCMAEIARTSSQREQGLMHRKELKDGHGMLFIFERDEILSFWMKNTLVPLSIAFITYDGRILEFFDMQPGNLNPVHSSRSVRYALEVPQGWFDRVGIRPGDKLEINFL